MDEFRFNYFQEEFPMAHSENSDDLLKVIGRNWNKIAQNISVGVSAFKAKQFSKIDSFYLEQREQARAQNRERIRLCTRWDRYI